MCTFVQEINELENQKLDLKTLFSWRFPIKAL